MCTDVPEYDAEEAAIAASYAAEAELEDPVRAAAIAFLSRRHLANAANEDPAVPFGD